MSTIQPGSVTRAVTTRNSSPTPSLLSMTFRRLIHSRSRLHLSDGLMISKLLRTARERLVAAFRFLIRGPALTKELGSRKAAKVGTGLPFGAAFSHSYWRTVVVSTAF